MENCATLTAVGPRLRRDQLDKQNMKLNLLNRKTFSNWTGIILDIHTKDKWWDRSLISFSFNIISPNLPPSSRPAMHTPPKPFSWTSGDSSNSNTSGGNHLCLRASHYRSRVWDCSDKTLSVASRPARDQHASPHPLLHPSTFPPFLFPPLVSFFLLSSLCFFLSSLKLCFHRNLLFKCHHIVFIPSSIHSYSKYFK